MDVEAVGSGVAKISMNKRTVHRAESYAEESGSFTGSVEKKYMDRVIKDVFGMKDHSEIAAARQCERGSETVPKQHLRYSRRMGTRAFIKGDGH